MNELVTVLIITYNGQQYIEQMLDSICFQNYKPLEVIISDDASTDDTVFVIDNWLKEKRRQDIVFKFIKNSRNLGVSGNISNAVKFIHGKYLFLADQDDLWRKDKISMQVEYLERNNDCELCICDRSAINKENKIICKSLMRYDNVKFHKRDYKDVLNNGSEYPANSICIRTRHINNIFPIPYEIVEHDTFITIMAAHYGKVGYVRKPLTLYRIHDKNLSGNYLIETCKNFFIMYKCIVKIHKRKNKRELIDPIILKKELKRRFNENNIKFSRKLYPGKVRYVYIASIKYILRNIRSWKKFVK